jgi:hypothetical protein
MSVSGQIKLGMREKRLLTAKDLDGFVYWLNHEDLQFSDWNRAKMVSLLRSPELFTLLKDLHLVASDDGLSMHIAKQWALTGSIQGRLEAAIAGQAAKTEWEDSDRLRLLTLCNAIPDFMVRASSVRECACGCGKWFLSERQNRKHYDNHRKKASERRATPERKERRRIKGVEYSQRWRQRTFEADTSAQGN